MVKLYAPAGSQVVYDQNGAEYAVSNGYIDVPPNAVGGLLAQGFVVDPSAALAAMGIGKKAAKRGITPLHSTGNFIDAAIAADITYHQSFLAEQDFTYARVVLFNRSTADIINAKAAIGFASSSANSLINGGTLVTATFSGAGTVTIPAAIASGGTADATVGFVVSDEMQVTSVARSDGGRGYIPFVRVFQPAAGNTRASYATIGNSSAATFDANLGVRCGFYSGDAIATPANNPSASVNGAAAMLICYNKIAQVSVASFGDSLTMGLNSTHDALSALRIAADAINQSSSVKIAVANYGCSNRKQVPIYDNFVRYLTIVRPSVAILSPWSPNDASSVLREPQTILYATKFVNDCRSAGVIPVLNTPNPQNGLSAGNETLRRSIATSLRNLVASLHSAHSPVYLIDRDFIYTDYSVSTGGYLSGLNSDTIHPNYTGYALEAASVQSLLISVMPA